MSDTDSIIEATTVSIKTLVDGTMRATIQIEPYRMQDWVSLGLGQPGIPIAVARLGGAAASSPNLETPKHPKGQYGDEAEQLWLSGIFMTKRMCEAVGTDKDFLYWLRQQQCCVRQHNHGGDVVAAHVRRVSEGAGVGIKPEYMAVPMCDKHHTLQHQKGYSSVIEGGIEGASELARQHRRRWAWEALKRELGYESWRDIPPDEVIEWARNHELLDLFPNRYIERANEISQAKKKSPLPE